MCGNKCAYCEKEMGFPNFRCDGECMEDIFETNEVPSRFMHAACFPIWEADERMGMEDAVGHYDPSVKFMREVLTKDRDVNDPNAIVVATTNDSKSLYCLTCNNEFERVDDIQMFGFPVGQQIIHPASDEASHRIYFDGIFSAKAKDWKSI